jgi:hypothetical protein
MKVMKLVVLVWAMKSFHTFDGVLEFLNQLPPERAIEAKVACTELMQPCQVFYREAK